MVTRSNDKWFDMPAGNYCGLLIKERTAKKLQKMLYRQTQEIKDLLMQNKEDLMPMSWTLAYPNGEQTTVYYSDYFCDEDIERKIKLYNEASRLRYCNGGVFISDKTGIDARNEVKEFYKSMYGDDENNSIEEVK